MDVVELTRELVAVPSVLGETGQIEDYVAGHLEEIEGAEVGMQPVPGCGRNVIARAVKGENAPTILLNGHLDTVMVCQGWKREPFDPVAEEDRLYGLGSADMKAGVAIALETFRLLAEAGDVNVIFAGTVDEEGDSAGAFALLDAGIRADLCLIPEPSGGRIMMGCRGRVVYRVDVRGASAHGAVPDTGVNAISEASSFVTRLGELPLARHGLLGTGSVCVLEFTGGTETLSVPDHAVLKLDRHYVIGEEPEGMLADLRELAAGLGSPASFDILPWPDRPTPFLEPYITPDDGLAGMFRQAVGAEIMYGKSVGDYNAFARHMPTVVYGPAGGNWHGPDEWVSISSMRGVLDGYRRFARALAGIS